MKRRILIVSSSIAILIFAFGMMSFFSSQREDPELKTPPVIKKYVDTES